MPNADEKTNNSPGLWVLIKRLTRLHGEYWKLMLMEKMIILLSALTLTYLLVGFGMMILFYIGEFSVQLLATATGSLALGHILVACIYLLIGCCIYLMRERLIVRPFTRFISQLFKQ